MYREFLARKSARVCTQCEYSPYHRLVSDDMVVLDDDEKTTPTDNTERNNHLELQNTQIQEQKTGPETLAI